MEGLFRVWNSTPSQSTQVSNSHYLYYRGSDKATTPRCWCPPVCCKGHKADQWANDEEDGGVEHSDVAHLRHMACLLRPHGPELPAEEALPGQHLDGQDTLSDKHIQAMGQKRLVSSWYRRNRKYHTLKRLQ